MAILADGVGNTRQEPKNKLYSHLDYLRVRRDEMSKDDFELLLDFIVKRHCEHEDIPWSPGAGAVWYNHKITGAYGVVGGFSINEKGLYSAMIDLPGEYFEQTNPSDQWHLLVGLYYRFNVKCSRIDLAIDDPEYYVIPIDEMREAYARGQNFRFRNHKYVMSSSGLGDCDETDYFGSRNSGKMVRTYDHEGECHRFEVEFKRGFAQPVFEEILFLKREDAISDEGIAFSTQKGISASDSQMSVYVQKAMSAIALGAIDFRDRGNREDKSRVGVRDSVRLDFWQEFIDRVAGYIYRVQVVKPVRTLEKTLEWVKRQCSGTLAMFKEGMGREGFYAWVWKLVGFGEERMSQEQRMWAAEIREKPRLVGVGPGAII